MKTVSKVVNCHEGDFFTYFESLICVSIACWGKNQRQKVYMSTNEEVP